MMNKYLFSGLAMGLIGLLSACDCHHDLHPSISVGSLVCADGSIISASEAQGSPSMPVAVVFHVNKDADAQDGGLGYAVWLHEMAPAALADSLGVSQNTSVSITDFEGNANTYSMYVGDVRSPAARQVFSMWSHGQSAYIPSVGQMRLLYRSRDVINPIIVKSGGDIIPLDGSECWYWSSTEVAGQEPYKAWLYSLGAGQVLETPKDEEHKLRPVITITD